MKWSPVVAALAARRWWLYGGGLVALVLVRTRSVPRWVRLVVTGVVLLGMVATYAAERLAETGGPIHRGMALMGVGGLTLGVGLTVTGRLAGLAFVAGGLLFVHRAIGEGAT